jgi:hypothetical protein
MLQAQGQWVEHCLINDHTSQIYNFLRSVAISLKKSEPVIVAKKLEENIDATNFTVGNGIKIPQDRHNFPAEIPRRTESLHNDFVFSNHIQETVFRFS